MIGTAWFNQPMAHNPYKHMRPNALSRSARTAKAQAIREGKAEWDRTERVRLESLLGHRRYRRIQCKAGRWHPAPRTDGVPSAAGRLDLRTALDARPLPGLRSAKAIDLRVVPRPPETALIAIAAKLRCERCRRQAPAPAIVKLTKRHDV
jgi:hypothetical protein